MLVSHGGAASFGPRRHAHPPLPRPLPRRRRDRRHATSTTPASSARRSSSRDARARRAARRAVEIDRWSLPDPDGRLGAALARQLGAGHARPRRPSTPRSATPAPRPRSSARSARSTRRAPSGSSGSAAAGRRGVTITARRAGARRGRGSPPRSPAGAAVTLRRCAARRAASWSPSGETVPMGVPPGERPVRARRRRDAEPARRPLRRLRHHQHAAVDPSPLHQLRQRRSSCSSRSRATAAVHTLRREPDDARPVRRPAADRGDRSRRRGPRHAAGDRARGASSRSAARSSWCCAATRYERGAPGLRLQGPAALEREDTR